MTRCVGRGRETRTRPISLRLRATAPAIELGRGDNLSDDGFPSGCIERSRLNQQPAEGHRDGAPDPKERTGPCWRPAKFKRADKFDGAIETSGYIYRGLGLQMSIAQSLRGRRPPWLLIHLNSGHVICQISGVVAKAFPIAAEIAECTDWGFSGLDGWNNTDPDLPSKVRIFAERYPKHIISISGASDRVIAEQISAERALA